ncbi:uncharacterized protein LOC111120045 isoform X2 [Crassostrea virginica]
MTSFLFVVKIPITEDERDAGSSDGKSESDDSSKNKDNESDVEDKDVSKDADKESPSDTETDATKPSPSKDQTKEQEEEGGWDFGEGDPGEGEDSNLVGVEESGKEVTVSSDISTQSQGKSSANAPATVITNQSPSQRGNFEQLQGREIAQAQDGNTVQSKTGKEKVPQEENNAQQPQDGNVTQQARGKNISQQENITQQKEDVNSVQSQAVNISQSQAGNSNPAQDGDVTKTNDPQTQSVDSQNAQDLTGKPQPSTNPAGAGKEKANGNNNLMSGPEGSVKTALSNEETSPEKVEVTVIGENTEQKKSPKRTFTVEKAQEDSLPVNDVGERKNPMEGIVEHLEKSESVPPGKLHGKLPLPKSLSDDRISDAGKPEFQTVKFIDDEPLIEVVKRVVESFSIDNFSVQETENGDFYQVIFLDEGGERCESILNQLAKEKIGDHPGTSISIFPSTIYRGNIPKDSDEEAEEDGEEDDRDEETPFKKSIKARMLVTQVFNTVRDNAQFTFDYLVLCVVASVLACLGLVENSSVILVASMLISPLMGPILGGTFGTVMQNKSLRNLGIKNELIGLMICVISGLLFGFISGAVGIKGANWGSTDSWPTDEMKSRGVPRGLWVGVFIALPSGIGVALSVLGGNSGSLIGVAISASLLPPAVNAGMLWAYSIITAIRPPDLDVTYKNVTIGNKMYLDEIFNPTELLNCKPFLNNKYSPVHSCDMATEALCLGLISLSLTLLNILCIFIMGIAFLKIKEVAPQHTTTDSTRDFWSQHIQVVKESYSTSKGPQSMQLASQARKLLEDWKNKKGNSAETTLKLQKFMEEVENSPEYNQFLPNIGGNLYSRYLKKDFEEAMHEVQQGYIPETRVVEEKTKSGYNVYRTFHGIQPTTRKRHKSRVTFDVEEEAPSKSARRPMSDGNEAKTPTSKRFSMPLSMKSNLYSRRKSKESGARMARFKVSKVNEDQEEGSEATSPMLDSKV